LLRQEIANSKAESLRKALEGQNIRVAIKKAVKKLDMLKNQRIRALKKVVK